MPEKTAFWFLKMGIALPTELCAHFLSITYYQALNAASGERVLAAAFFCHTISGASTPPLE